MRSSPKESFSAACEALMAICRPYAAKAAPGLAPMGGLPSAEALGFDMTALPGLKTLGAACGSAPTIANGTEGTCGSPATDFHHGGTENTEVERRWSCVERRQWRGMRVKGGGWGWNRLG